MRVSNMVSSNGNDIPNQFIIHMEDGSVVFQSYSTVIAIKQNGTVVLDKDWNYSRTTSKYRNQFLRETTKETERKIKSGKYEVKELNK